MTGLICPSMFFFSCNTEYWVNQNPSNIVSTESIPVVMTTPAKTFLLACGDVKLSVSSLNLSTTKRDTASAKT